MKILIEIFASNLKKVVELEAKVALGTEQLHMADKKAIGLMTDQQLFTYVLPLVIRYLSVLFLNMFTVLALKQSADNLLHLFIVLCENEYFLTSNQHCSFSDNITILPHDKMNDP